MTNPTGPRSEIHVPRNRTTTGISTESTPVTTSLPLSTTTAQTTAPLTFGSLPPITRVIATITDAGTHYSTVTTTTRGGTGDDYVHVTGYDSSESEQEHDTPLEGEEILIILDTVDAVIGRRLMSPEERRIKHMRT